MLYIFTFYPALIRMQHSNILWFEIWLLSKTVWIFIFILYLFLLYAMLILSIREFPFVDAKLIFPIGTEASPQWPCYHVF